MKRLMICKLFGHTFGEWLPIIADPCEQVRTCVRCGRQECRDAHAWGEWQVASDGRRWRVCVRCGHRMTAPSPSRT